MDNNKYDLVKILRTELKQRNNPTDLKSVVIGVVENLTPLTVSVSESKILLTEGNELIISEGFRFRCNIDKTSRLSQSVPSDLETSKSSCDSAKGVTETHSYTGTACGMPDAISYLATAIDSTNSAIEKVKNELLASCK